MPTHPRWRLMLPLGLLLVGLLTVPAQAKFTVVTPPTKAAATNDNPVGGDAPGFDVMTLGEHSKHLMSKDLYGKKPVLLFFWASWSDPAKSEATVLNELYGKYGTQVQFVAISLDRSKDVEQDLQNVYDVIDDLGLKFPMAMDDEDLYTDRFAIASVPKLVCVDLKGNIAADLVGFDSADEVRATFQDAFHPKEPASSASK